MIRTRGSISPVMGENEVPMASRWRPPDQGSYKLNMAFYVDPCLNLVGVGSLIRDADGSVRAAMTQRMVSCDDKLQLQATVVLLAVKFAFDVGFRSLDVDLSFSELYHFLQSEGPCLASIGNIVDDILLFRNSCNACKLLSKKKKVMLVSFLLLNLRVTRQRLPVMLVSFLLLNLRVTRQRLPWQQRHCPQLLLRRGLITAL
jgi:hypothetical protein